MLLACKGLEQTLKEITRSVAEGDMSRMGELLSRRSCLMEEIQALEPCREDVDEVAEVLRTVISLEQLVTELAREKKQEIMEEMKGIKSRRKAYSAYGNQSLKGVRP